MEELFNKLIEVRDISQQMHWNKSDTGFNHESLEEFYTSLLEHSDIFIEVYQGQHGLIENFGEFKKVDFSDKTKYFEEFATYVNSKRTDIADESIHLNSIMDDILIDTYKLIYKMKHLK